MAVIGEFPGFVPLNRRTVRAPSNPLDKSTVVSIFPKTIIETKPTLMPGTFTVQSGSYENPTLYVIGPSSWWKEVDENQPLLEIPQSSIQIADSIVKDYCNGLLSCNMTDATPGLFYIPGEITPAELKTKYKNLLDKAQANQKRWYTALVKLADALWARTNGNPLGISDDMRLAAHELHLKDKDWMKDFTAIENIRCVACGSLRNPTFPICPTCHAVIDTDLAKKLNLKFAE